MADSARSTYSDSSLQWLVDAVAGRTLPIVREPVATAWTDGETLHLPAASARDPLIAVTQALWVAAGSVDALPRGFPQPTPFARYLAFELARALRCHGHCLPSALAVELGRHAAKIYPASAEESLIWARDPTRVVAALPAFLGTVKSSRKRAPAALVAGEAAQPQRDVKSLGERGVTSRRDRFLQWFTNPLASSNWMSELVLQLLGFEHSAGEKSHNEAGSAALAATADTGPDNATSMVQRIAARLHASGAARTFNAQWHYPEWSEKVGRYRPAWVAVHEVTPAESATDAPEEPLSRMLLRELAVDGMRLRRRRHQLAGDEPEVDTLIDRIVARRAGSEIQPRYTSLVRDSRDLSVLVLVDASGSTNDRNPSGATLINEHRWAATQLAKGFGQLGDAVAIYGFQSYGRQALRISRIKRFDEPFALRCRQRLAALTPAGFTRMGGAIRHATALLRQQQHVEHRLLVILSDGLPYDTEYSDRYAEADTARALGEAAQAGIACICVAFGGDREEDEFNRVYGETAYVKLHHRKQLFTRLRALLRSAFKQAA